MSTPNSYTGPYLAEIAHLMGDPARANMLHALMDGRALTAKELAWIAGVAPQTASGHLAKLMQGGLLAVAAQGRHRYYRLAGPEVAQALEGLMVLASMEDSGRRLPSRVGAELSFARTCYDHFAGKLGIGIPARPCAPASTGASADRISPATSLPRSPAAASRWAGHAAARTVARSS
jgi:DNA-binding transcriptional ArsR family regulator